MSIILHLESEDIDFSTRVIYEFVVGDIPITCELLEDRKCVANFFLDGQDNIKTFSSHDTFIEFIKTL